MLQTIRTPALVASLALSLVACGQSANNNNNNGTGGAGSPSPSAMMAEPSPVAITMTAVNYSFSPSTLTVAAGQPVTITITNNGNVPHNLTIATEKINQDLDPGKSATVTFTPTASGPSVLQFHCEYHEKSHHMLGGITVTGATGAAEPVAGMAAGTPSPYHY